MARVEGGSCRAVKGGGEGGSCRGGKDRDWVCVGVIAWKEGMACTVGPREGVVCRGDMDGEGVFCRGGEARECGAFRRGRV